MSEETKPTTSGAANAKTEQPSAQKKDSAKVQIERISDAPVTTGIAYVPYVTHETSDHYEHFAFDEQVNEFEVTEDVAVRAISCFRCEQLPGAHTGGKCAEGLAPDLRFRVKADSKVRIKGQELPK